MTLCAARRLHLAKFERAILGLLLASNALAAAPDSDKPSEAAVDVSHPPLPPVPNRQARPSTHAIHHTTRCTR